MIASDSNAPPPPFSAHLATGWTQRFATALARRIARVYFKMEVSGLEHLPAREACLLCANHTSHVDTFALACASGRHSTRLVFLAARDYFSQSFWRRLLVRRLICLMPFERRSGMAAAKHNLGMLAACRDAGRIIVLFPEGTRSPDGSVRDFKPGVALFADKLSLRVVPCRIDGAHSALAKGKRLPRPRRLRVTFGAPMALPPPPAAETNAERLLRYTRFTGDLQQIVTGLNARAPAPEEAFTA
jgi:1-acyl-sn-glycerol-3-phosphate acyltransferase